MRWLAIGAGVALAALVISGWLYQRARAENESRARQVLLQALRQGQAVGCKVTLRKARMYEFMTMVAPPRFISRSISRNTCTAIGSRPRMGSSRKT